MGWDTSNVEPNPSFFNCRDWGENRGEWGRMREDVRKCLLQYKLPTVLHWSIVSESVLGPM